MADYAYCNEEAALAAAHKASEATAMLIRIAREGAYDDYYPLNLDFDVILNLADALNLAIAVAPPENDFGYNDEREILGELRASLTRFIERWLD